MAKASRRKSLSYVELREYERQMWFFGGALIHGFNIAKLDEIYEQYRSVDLVPKNFHLPSLY